MCTGCDGQGQVEVRRTMRIRIPPRVHDGQTVRIRGEGLTDPESGLRGDAFVVVRVLAPPRERRILRTLAVLGLLVAVALIVKLGLGVG